jgi:hypothetical protein
MRGVGCNVDSISEVAEWSLSSRCCSFTDGTESYRPLQSPFRSNDTVTGYRQQMFTVHVYWQILAIAVPHRMPAGRPDRRARGEQAAGRKRVLGCQCEHRADAVLVGEGMPHPRAVVHGEDHAQV